MVEWIMANAATVIVGVVLFGSAAAVLLRLIRRRMHGETGCSSCAGCPSSQHCKPLESKSRR